MSDLEKLAAEERFRTLANAVKAILPIGDDAKPDSAVFPIYVRMSELRALHSLAALRARTPIPSSRREGGE